MSKSRTRLLMQYTKCLPHVIQRVPTSLEKQRSEAQNLPFLNLFGHPVQHTFCWTKSKKKLYSVVFGKNPSKNVDRSEVAGGHERGQNTKDVH